MFKVVIYIRLNRFLFLLLFIGNALVLNSCKKKKEDVPRFLPLSDNEYNEVLDLHNEAQADLFGFSFKGKSEKFWKEVFKEYMTGDDFKKPVVVSTSNAFEVGQIVRKRISDPPLASMNLYHGFSEENIKRHIKTTEQIPLKFREEEANKWNFNLDNIFKILGLVDVENQIDININNGIIKTLNIDKWWTKRFQDSNLFIELLFQENSKIKSAYRKAFKPRNYFIQKIILVEGFSFTIQTTDSVLIDGSVELITDNNLNLRVEKIANNLVEVKSNTPIKIVPVIDLWKIDY